MKKTDKFSISKRQKSFSYAFNGLKYLIKYEHNFRIHLFAAIFIIIIGFVFKLTLTEWSILLIIISIVFITEIINSSIECLADFISPEYSEFIKKVKDLSSSAVLVAALVSIIIGIIIFLPKIYTCFN